MPKTKYGDIKIQMAALAKKQQAMEQQAANAFVKVLMASDAREKLADMPEADVKAVARLVAADMDGYIARAQEDKAAKAAAKEAPAPAAPVEAPRQEAPQAAQRPQYPGYIQQ